MYFWWLLWFVMVHTTSLVRRPAMVATSYILPHSQTSCSSQYRHDKCVMNNVNTWGTIYIVPGIWGSGVVIGGITINGYIPIRGTVFFQEALLMYKGYACKLHLQREGHNGTEDAVWDIVRCTLTPLSSVLFTEDKYGEYIVPNKGNDDSCGPFY